MCSFIFANKKLQNEKLNFVSAKRGPDYTNTFRIGQFNMIHNLLDISETHTLQPITKDDITLLFNGEIYNQYLECDTLSIVPTYKEYGEKFVEHLNGEYAIVILDSTKNVIYLYSDIFATKPLFYCIQNNDVGIATYASELKLLGFDRPLRVKPSSYIKINLNDYSAKEYNHSKFNLDEYKTTYDDCINALENSIASRCNKRCAVGLSSGYDSGAILQWSLLNNSTENSFYYITNNRENETIMFNRFNKCKEHNLQYHTVDYYKNKSINDLIEFKALSEGMEDFENYKNHNAVFMLSRLISTIKRDGFNIFISGQGSDEILSNYVKDTSFFYNLKHQFPWNNFYEGKNRYYIDELEYVGGCYGVEVRYPYLDKFFVQEFLNLSHKLKTAKYKSVIQEYLGNLSTSITKTGMSCSSHIHKSIKTNFII
jgi:asparagine synthetase B (glutamine-hydrolysing)